MTNLLKNLINGELVSNIYADEEKGIFSKKYPSRLQSNLELCLVFQKMSMVKNIPGYTLLVIAQAKHFESTSKKKNIRNFLNFYLELKIGKKQKKNEKTLPKNKARPQVYITKI